MKKILLVGKSDITTFTFRMDDTISMIVAEEKKIPEVLTWYNYDIKLVPDGITGTVVLWDENFDLILIAMPCKDWDTMVKEIKKVGDLPIIMISNADTDIGIVKKAVIGTGMVGKFNSLKKIRPLVDYFLETPCLSKDLLLAIEKDI